MRKLGPARHLGQAGLLMSLAVFGLAPGSLAGSNGLGVARALSEVSETPTLELETLTPSPTSTTDATPTSAPSPSPTGTTEAIPTSTPSPSPTASSTPSEATLSPTPSASPTATPSPVTSTPTSTPTATSSATVTATPTETTTSSPTSAPPTPFVPLAVLINEISWAGTLASANDEWIELHNPGPEPIDLTGWKLTDGGDIHVTLSGAVAGFSYFLLERTDNTTVSDLAADQIYTGALKNTGERLELLGPAGELVDTANSSGGGWPAGNSETRASMERRGGTDLPGNWATFTGYFGSGLDAAGDPIQGTPRQTNSLFIPTPTPTGIPSRVVINEVLIRPRHDWEGTGGVTTADEFIELYNPGRMEVYLKGWFLDDSPGSGSSPFDLPGVTIPAKDYVVFFRSQTKIALNDSGDTVRLLAPDGRVIDEISYLSVRAYNLTYGRLPDGSDNLSYGLWPTPRQPNLLFVEPIPEPPTGPFFPYVCSGEAWPAGGKLVRASMERIGFEDSPANWLTFSGSPGDALDAQGNPISGTPRNPNSVTLASPLAPARPSVLIYEVAWAGTDASASDEWIELHNAGPGEIDLAGWQLTDGADVKVRLSGVVGPGGYFLLERTDDHPVSNLPADLIYTGSLRDQGEILWLSDPAGEIVDSANAMRPGHPVSLLGRAARQPAQVAWLRELNLLGCGPSA